MATDISVRTWYLALKGTGNRQQKNVLTIVATEVVAFAKENGADGVATAQSPSPRFDEICDRIEEALSLEVEVCSSEPFVDYDGYIDLKRFSRYWRVAHKYVFEQK